MPDNRHLRFDLAGDFALAGYFLMAHWPNPDTAPELDVADGRMVLHVDVAGSGLADLRSTLTKLANLGGAISESAAAWFQELEAKTSRDQQAPDTRAS